MAGPAIASLVINVLQIPALLLLIREPGDIYLFAAYTLPFSLALVGYYFWYLQHHGILALRRHTAAPGRRRQAPVRGLAAGAVIAGGAGGLQRRRHPAGLHPQRHRGRPLHHRLQADVHLDRGERRHDERLLPGALAGRRRHATGEARGARLRHPDGLDGPADRRPRLGLRPARQRSAVRRPVRRRRPLFRMAVPGRGAHLHQHRAGHAVAGLGPSEAASQDHRHVGLRQPGAERAVGPALRRLGRGGGAADGRDDEPGDAGDRPPAPGARAHRPVAAARPAASCARSRSPSASPSCRPRRTNSGGWRSRSARRCWVAACCSSSGASPRRRGPW